MRYFSGYKAEPVVITRAWWMHVRDEARQPGRDVNVIKRSLTVHFSSMFLLPSAFISCLCVDFCMKCAFAVDFGVCVYIRVRASTGYVSLSVAQRVEA